MFIDNTIWNQSSHINDLFDFDKDGIINELDLDSDNDGILDVIETRDAQAVDNNHDGMVDGIDEDGDGLLPMCQAAIADGDTLGRSSSIRRSRSSMSNGLLT